MLIKQWNMYMLNYQILKYQWQILKRLHWFNPFERLNRALCIYKQIIIIFILGIILNNYKEVYFGKEKKCSCIIIEEWL